MLDARSIVTAPMALASGVGVTELATIAAADALVRRAWAVGRAADLVVPTLRGDLGGQYAFDVHLAREGLDRSALGPADLDRRRQAFEAGRQLAAAETLSRLSVTADLGAAPTTSSVGARAAQTAFVRLFEEGLVEEAEHVVATCSRCRTTVDVVDTVVGQVEVDELTIRVWAEDGAELVLRLTAPELLPGVVAVAVAPDAAGAGSTVVLPLAVRPVPVIADPMRHRPAVVVPAHDGDDLTLASAHGFQPVSVLYDDGTVAAPGPLRGLGRYAARAKARAMLEAEGVLVGVETVAEESWRCGRCGTVLVPQVGRHWFLRAAPLELAAADAVRNGLLTFSPPDARDAFLASAGVRRDWCISSAVDSGVAVPAAACLDCRKVTVEVDAASTCGKCMGTNEAAGEWVDARFVAAIWPLVHTGCLDGGGDQRWLRRGPVRNARPISAPSETMVVVSSTDLVGWVLPAVALGLRLASAAPFASVVVHPWLEPDGAPADDLLDEALDHRVVRLALIAGSLDLESATAAVAALDAPGSTGSVGDRSDSGVSASDAADGVAALDAGAPARAAALLASTLAAGVPTDAADRLRALALPILGDAP